MGLHQKERRGLADGWRVPRAWTRDAGGGSALSSRPAVTGSVPSLETAFELPSKMSSFK